MDTLIPPLDFSRSPSSFRTANESPTHTRHTHSSNDSAATPQQVPSPILEQIQDNDAAEPDVAQPTRHGSSASQSAKRNRLVKRQSQKLVKVRRFSKVQWKGFRCDIHASPGNYITFELPCKQLVINAGGKVIDNVVYPGGFLYQLPSGVQNPLVDGDSIPNSGCINISDWQPFRPITASLTKSASLVGPQAAAILDVAKRRTIAAPELLLSRMMMWG